MHGLPERTIVMSVDEAKTYTESRLVVLNQKKEELLNEIDKIDIKIDMEMQKLFMLNNPPQSEKCCRCNDATPIGNISCDIII